MVYRSVMRSRGAAGLRSLDPQLFGRLTAFASSGSSTDAPIGGVLALSSSRSTQQAQLTVDQLGRTAWSVGVRHKRRSLALSTDQTPGRFNYFDDGATLWTSSDDQISQRRNNDAGRAGFLWREQHSPLGHSSLSERARRRRSGQRQPAALERARKSA